MINWTTGNFNYIAGTYSHKKYQCSTNSKNNYSTTFNGNLFLILE